MHMHHKATAIDLPCACTTLRKATRAVSRIYDDSLASVGMNVTQLAILRAIGRAGDGGGALSPLATPQSTGSSALQKSWRRKLLDTAYERTSFARDSSVRHSSTSRFPSKLGRWACRRTQ